MSSGAGLRWRRVRRTPIGALSALLLLALLVVAVIAPIIWGGRAATIDTNALSQGPSVRHLLGTDSLGRDIFYRLLVATRVSIELALLATLIGVAVGVALGTAPSVLGRRAGRAITAAVNVAVAFPGLLLILFFAVIFGVTTSGAVLAVALAMAPFFARLTQTLAASIAGRDFIAAARVAGVSRVRILVRHILPNIGEQLVINAMIGAGSTLLAFAGLSFLGIGVQPPRYDWGVLLNEGLLSIYENPAGALGPAAAVVVAGLAFNLFGEAAAQVIGAQLASRPFGSRPKGLKAGDTPQQAGSDPVLVVENLRVSFPGHDGWTTPVRGISFVLHAGEAVGVVGESGSGKSLTSLALAGLIEPPGSVLADRLELQGFSLLEPGKRRRRRRLASSIAMVFQDPTASLNPAIKIGTQLSEISVQHEQMSHREARARAVAALAAVQVQAPHRRVRQYPHELSGGMRQRVMIAMGLMSAPRLIVADEPTTALDVTVQWQVLRLLHEARRAKGVAILLVSHDISVVAEICERVLVMYAGRVVEDLAVTDLVGGASHPYALALLAAVPDMESDRELPLAVIAGSPPAPEELGNGCAFAPRCPFADSVCWSEDPPLAQLGERHRVACWHPRSGEAELARSVKLIGTAYAPAALRLDLTSPGER